MNEIAITPNKWIKDPGNRKYIYGIAAAIGAALVGYQLITQDQLELWLNIAANVLLVTGSSLSLVNTPKKSVPIEEVIVAEDIQDLIDPEDHPIEG